MTLMPGIKHNWPLILFCEALLPQNTDILKSKFSIKIKILVLNYKITSIGISLYLQQIKSSNKGYFL